MKTQHAYNKITLEFGGNTVILRPSLRAALFLENLHGGFPALLRKLAQFDTRTVWHIIKETAGKTESDDLFGYAADKSLSSFADAAQAPLFHLVAALLPEAPEAEIEATTSAPVAWSDAFRELFKIATGWLGWSPEVAWNATPQEITDAFEAHIRLVHLIGNRFEGGGTDAATEVVTALGEIAEIWPEFVQRQN